MGSITINGKKVVKWVVGGKIVKSLTMGGKVLSFVDLNAWHYGGDNPHPNKNDWKGDWSSSAKEAEFEAVTTSVAHNQFTNEIYLISISLPNTTTIGSGSFKLSEIEEVNIPKATTIGDYAFYGVNIARIFTMNKKFDTNAEKDRIFGGGYWNNITFHWTNDDGTEYSNYVNRYSGSFSTTAKIVEFTTLKTSIADGQFSTELGLTMISLSGVKTIGRNAFYYAPITVVDLPECISIGADAFHYASLSGGLDIPNCETIGDGAFVGIRNAPTTQVRMKSKFNTLLEKNRIFGDSNWTNLKFYWV